MATDYSNRIDRVSARRNNSAVASLSGTASFANDSAFRDFLTDRYRNKTKSKSFQYALISMQEVDAQYTAGSYREAERVAKQIKSGLV